MNPVLIFPLLTVALLVIGLTFEILIRRLKSDHRHLWSTLGRPTGFFPSSITPTRSDIAAQKLLYIWFFRTPEWIRESRDHSLYVLCVFRIASALWVAGLFAWLVWIVRLSQAVV